MRRTSCYRSQFIVHGSSPVTSLASWTNFNSNLTLAAHLFVEKTYLTFRTTTWIAAPWLGQRRPLMIKLLASIACLHLLTRPACARELRSVLTQR